MVSSWAWPANPGLAGLGGKLDPKRKRNGADHCFGVWAAAVDAEGAQNAQAQGNLFFVTVHPDLAEPRATNNAIMTQASEAAITYGNHP